MKKITASILTTLLMLSMVFSSSVFAANEEVSAWDSFLGLFSGNATTTATDAVGVEYRGHIQNVGNFPLDGTWIQGPNQLGTVGQSLRLEGFWIRLSNQPENVNIQYRVHVQNEGWMTPVENGAFAGTEGKSQQIEAIEINLVDDEGNAVQGYSVQYKGHIQNQGDTAWFEDGQQLGTVGSFLRLEALEVKIVTEKADMAAYEAAVAEATALTEADYTAASWAALETALIDNLVTEDNTQAEVDAATAAINAAIDALVLVPAITEAKAINVNEIQVTFNQAITDTTKATFTLKRGAANINIASVTWSDDKTQAVVKSAIANLNTSATDTVAYTLTTAGLTDAALVNTVNFAPVVESALVVTSEQIDFVANSPLKFEVQNQYGKSMNVAGTLVTGVAYNLTQDKVQTITGQATSQFNFAAAFNDTTEPLDAEAAAIGDQIRVTLSYKSFTVQQTLTVGAATPAAAPATIALGTVAPLEGKTMIVQGDTGLVLPATVKDQFGEDFQLPVTGAGADVTSKTIQGVTFSSSNTAVVNVGSLSVDADGVIKFDTKNAVGTATITAIVNKTGVIATTTIATKATAVMSSVTIVQPTTVVAKNDGTIELEYVAQDQYGNVLDWTKAADKALIQAGFAHNTTSAATIVSGMALNADGELIATIANNATGNVTLKATDGATVEFGSVTFEVLDTAVLTSITGVKDLTTKVSEGVATTISKDNLVTVDQYGRPYTLATPEGALVYFKSGASTALALTGATGADIAHAATINFDGSTNAVATGTATAGSSTLVIALVTDITNSATAVAGGTFEVALTNETNIVSYAVKPVTTLYGLAGHTAASPYAKVLTIVGLDAGGNEVAVDQTKFTALSSSNPAIIGTDSATRKVFAIDEGSATVSVWMGATKVADTVVTASAVAPQGQTVEFDPTANVITADGGTLALATTLEVVDQYGVVLTNPQTLGTWSIAPGTAVGTTVSQAGLVTASSLATGNGTATVSFVLANGNDSGTVAMTISGQAN